MNAATLEQARSAKNTLAAQLADLPELRGIGVAFLPDGYAVKVLLERLPDGIVIPAEVDGVPVRIDITGELELL